MSVDSKGSAHPLVQLNRDQHLTDLTILQKRGVDVGALRGLESIQREMDPKQSVRFGMYPNNDIVRLGKSETRAKRGQEALITHTALSRVFESGDHTPIECGFFRAYCFTDAGARRSELPSRSTGLTALPLIRSYRARASTSASPWGSSG